MLVSKRATKIQQLLFSDRGLRGYQNTGGQTAQLHEKKYIYKTDLIGYNKSTTPAVSQICTSPALMKWYGFNLWSPTGQFTVFVKDLLFLTVSLSI